MYTLKLHTTWNEVKEQLKEINFELTDDDLDYQPGKEEELLERLSQKMNRSIEHIKNWIESVSFNRGIAG